MLDEENGSEIDNLTISVVDDLFTLHYLLDKGNPVKFRTVAHLIKYYKKHRLPNERRLVKAIHRPWWLLRHAAVKYDESGKLGSGHFCNVFRGKVTIDKNETDVAIKICHIPTEAITPEALLEARTSLIKEAKLMVEYNNTNVVKFYGVACDRPPVMILMELCAGGSMDNLLRKKGKDISNTEKFVYLYEVREGIIKVADFGLSVTLEHGNTLCKSIIKEAPIRVLDPEQRPSFDSIGDQLRESVESSPEVEPQNMVVNQLKGVVDPRYPNLSPRRLSLWELFFTLQLSDSGNENEKLACKTIRTAVEIEKSAKPLADPTAKSGGPSAEVVAASHKSSEQGNVIVAETTKICSTPDKKLSIAPTPMFSAEKLLKESAKKAEPNSVENLVTPTSKELLSNERIALDEYKAPPTLSLAKTMSSIRSVQLEAKVTRSNETLLPPKYGSTENLNKVTPKRQSAEQLSPEKVPLLPLIAANKSSISAPP
ncbi:hypothetical protein NECAME_04790 [Necator americanus]|uniref:Protein kinase domain-containing protein n=1 Tax=Necator americanus TaxID=51031 RepID=W2SQ32_NECAM|nr:hypothetical protein NECAME_04790 [Necator americanus]ETN70777.1 hypothetical protein NECAME_04790 [Necator americanus]